MAKATRARAARVPQRMRSGWVAAFICALTGVGCGAAEAQPRPLVIDYPVNESIFPPEITPPMFLWRDPAASATLWKIDVSFADGAAAVHATSRGERMRTGAIDPECIAKSNELPKLTPAQAAAHTWKPDAAEWTFIKQHSVTAPAAVAITGYAAGRIVSRGSVTIRTSRDPVGAPIFYRDVPLMPTETEKGQIKPLAPQALPLVGWRLRDIGKRESRLLLTNMPVCANCHSFSADGKTMGMDLDGLQNNKGQYFLTPVRPETSVAWKDVIQWRTGAGRLQGNIRAGFMSQVSPDGQYVATTINPAELDGPHTQAPRSNYYVTNYRDYRFLQVFYPTRGVLAWYSRATGRLQPLPGADDPRYVQMTAVWSPDGQYLVFARATAQEPNPAGAPVALAANDPNERQIRYELYRIPFANGRGGKAEPLVGASANGMSNTFPKVSPDGKWIVYVQCRNGQLMRPDSKLYIVPAAGGVARRMRCNTPLMNSWHSFSPNGRWMVFSSKARSPYTQMYLTHIDEDGNDSPAILIDDATAANRAVNLPEFVNIVPGGMEQLGGAALDYYKRFNRALFLQKKGRLAESAAEWQRTIEANPDDPITRDNFGMTLLLAGRREEANRQIAKARELRLRKTLETAPDDADARVKLGQVLQEQGRGEEALAELRRAVEFKPESAAVHCVLGDALAAQGRADEALMEFQRAVALDVHYAPALYGLGQALEARGETAEAIAAWRNALGANPDYAEAHLALAHALAARGETAEALEQWRAGLPARPHDVRALREAAWVLATSADGSLRNGREALVFAVRALELSAARRPGDGSAKKDDQTILLDTLAAAYAECGRYADAVSTVRRALALARAGETADLRRRLDLYQRQMAFHGTAAGSR